MNRWGEIEKKKTNEEKSIFNKKNSRYHHFLGLAKQGVKWYSLDFSDFEFVCVFVVYE